MSANEILGTRIDYLANLLRGKQKAVNVSFSEQDYTGPLPLQSLTMYVTENSEYSFAILDAEGKVVFGVPVDTVVGGKWLDDVPQDNNVYVLKNGELVAARVYEAPEEWLPEITSSDTLSLTVDNDMQSWQLTGTNTEVNS